MMTQRSNMEIRRETMQSRFLGSQTSPLTSHPICDEDSEKRRQKIGETELQRELERERMYDIIQIPLMLFDSPTQIGRERM